eukprot:4152831-Pleurochrysis_carterae.AAC.1
MAKFELAVLCALCKNQYCAPQSLIEITSLVLSVLIGSCIGLPHRNAERHIDVSALVEAVTCAVITSHAQ